MNSRELTVKYTDASLETWNTDYIRHNVYTESGQKALELFEKAAELMKQRSAEQPVDPLGWYYQAGIYGIFFTDMQIGELASCVVPAG